MEPEEESIFQRLHENGYRIGFFGKNDVLSKRSLDKFVERHCPPTSDHGAIIEKPQAPNKIYSFLYGQLDSESVKTSGDHRTITDAIQFLSEGDRERPTFAYVALTFPHPPYHVEEPYFSQFDDVEIDPPVPFPNIGAPDFVQHLRAATLFPTLTTDEITKLQKLYFGMIARTDHLFGQLLAALDRLDLSSSTAVFFTSDHGNYAGDYGLPEKWHTGFHDALMHVPLAIRIPGIPARGVQQSLVQHLDIAPTILEVAGLSLKEASGKSLLPLLTGEALELRSEVFGVAGAFLECEQPINIARASLANTPVSDSYFPFVEVFQSHPECAGLALALRDRRWKYVWRHYSSDELYDLESDPNETHNLLAGNSNYEHLCTSFRKRLTDWFLRTKGNGPGQRLLSSSDDQARRVWVGASHPLHDLYFGKTSSHET